MHALRRQAGTHVVVLPANIMWIWLGALRWPAARGMGGVCASCVKLPSQSETPVTKMNLKSALWFRT